MYRIFWTDEQCKEIINQHIYGCVRRVKIDDFSKAKLLCCRVYRAHENLCVWRSPDQRLWKWPEVGISLSNSFWSGYLGMDPPYDRRAMRGPERRSLERTGVIVEDGHGYSRRAEWYASRRTQKGPRWESPRFDKPILVTLKVTEHAGRLVGALKTRRTMLLVPHVRHAR